MSDVVAHLIQNFTAGAMRNEIVLSCENLVEQLSVVWSEKTQSVKVGMEFCYQVLDLVCHDGDKKHVFECKTLNRI